MIEKFKTYLNSLKNGEELKNRYNANSLKNSIFKILYNIKNDEPVAIYGDYDTDGIISALMSYVYLKKAKEMLKCKSDTDILFSNRREFFGMGEKLYKTLSEKYGLIIMTDNGADEKFLTPSINNLVILDHHPTQKDFDYIINPNIKTNRYSTSGGKVVFDFLRLLDANMKKFFNVSLFENRFYYDLFKQLSAITLISDMANLNKTNRDFIQSALKLMEKRDLPVFHLLKQINTTEISYNLISKINAVSRMEKDFSLIQKWIFPKNVKEFEFANKKINKINEKKKEIVLSIYNSMPLSIFNRNIVFFKKEDMPIGLTGLLANKILSEYSKPAIIVSKEGEYFVGSARGKNIKEFFDEIKLKNPNFFETGEYGGHLDAMGFKTKSLKDLEIIQKEIDNFEYKNQFNLLTDKVLTPDEFIALDKIYKQEADGVDFSEKINVFVNLDLNKFDKKEYKNYTLYSYKDFKMLLDKKTSEKASKSPIALVSFSVSDIANVKGFLNAKNDIMYNLILENKQIRQNIQNDVKKVEGVKNVVG
jgi:single-stranded-DNA-specific exonuclease